jgi:pimeloyl-ACP methyl ester carboxylesterase
MGMSTFVLIHGSWHDGSAWKGVARRLEELGHVAHAPTTAGHGKGVDKNVTHSDAVKSVVDFVIERDLNDFVLVGHSSGGMTISKAVESISDRVRRLVYVAGFVPLDGESQADMVPPTYQQIFDTAAASPDNTVMMPFEVYRTALMNDADSELARQAYEQLSPEPYGFITERMSFEIFHTLKTPKSYILPTEDISLPSDDEWGWHPRLTSRLGEHRFLQIPGSHEVVITNPVGLADTILEACAE